VATLVSDVAGAAPRPLTGDVLFVPDDQVATMLTNAEADPTAAGGLAYVSFTAENALLERYQVEVRPIADDGTFTVPAPLGPTLICLANSFPGQTSGAPYAVNGCAEVPDPVNADTQLRLTFGEGGVRVER
jgi:hypothetical protein